MFGFVYAFKSSEYHFKQFFFTLIISWDKYIQFFKFNFFRCRRIYLLYLLNTKKPRRNFQRYVYTVAPKIYTYVECEVHTVLFANIKRGLTDQSNEYKCTIFGLSQTFKLLVISVNATLITRSFELKTSSSIISLVFERIPFKPQFSVHRVFVVLCQKRYV